VAPIWPVKPSPARSRLVKVSPASFKKKNYFSSGSLLFNGRDDSAVNDNVNT
jgi:hypothetical protein